MKMVKVALGIAVSLALVACGGGSSNAPQTAASVPTPTVMRFSDVALNKTTSRATVAVLDKDFHEYTELRYTIHSDKYFEQNKDAHAAVVMRSDASLQATAVVGIGMVLGNVSGATNPYPGWSATQPNPLKPSTQAETWFGGTGSGNYLLASLSTPPVMQDGIDYDVTIISRISSDTKVKTVQYFIVVNGAEIYNSGEITDRNPVANVTRNDIYVGQVFDNPNATAWELKFKNISLQY